MAGAPASGKFLVNVDPAGGQRIQELTLLGDGNIYIAWTTTLGEAPGARIFDPTGATTDWAMNDTLTGTAGPDTLSGGRGNDRYIVNRPGDVVIEHVGEGTDIIYSSVSYSLNDGSEVESLFTITWELTTPLNLAGNNLANHLIGNAGANQLNGKAGADTMIGREGNDTYLVDNAGDRAFEAAGGGTDVVYSAVSFVLTDAQEIEGLSTITWELTNAINLTGNSLNNYLIGNAGVNVLDGRAGSDTMHGRAGGRTRSPSPPLWARATLTVSSTSPARTTPSCSRITACSSAWAGGALNANAFVIGTAAQDSSDRIVYNQATANVVRRRRQRRRGAGPVRAPWTARRSSPPTTSP